MNDDMPLVMNCREARLLIKRFLMKCLQACMRSFVSKQYGGRTYFDRFFESLMYAEWSSYQPTTIMYEEYIMQVIRETFHKWWTNCRRREPTEIIWIIICNFNDSDFVQNAAMTNAISQKSRSEK